MLFRSQDIIPSVSDFVAELCQNVAAKRAVCEKIPFETEKNLITRLAELNDKTSAAVEKLESDLKAINKAEVRKASKAMAHKIVPDMDELRRLVDEMETITSSDYWPYPTYFDILYSVK